MEELAREWIRGSTWFIERAASLVANSADPLAEAEKLRRVRPGMAPLDLLYILVKTAASRGARPQTAAERLLNYVEEAKQRLDDTLQGVKCPQRAATVSLSRAVARLLERCQGEVEVLYLMESRPGAEFQQAFATYSKYVKVVPLPDSAIATAEFDTALSGLDGLYLDYGVNKVGTLPLFAVAEAFGLSVVVVFESYKVAPVEAPVLTRVKYTLAGGIEVEVPLFDKIPHRFLKVLVTDLGVFRDAKELVAAAVERIYTYVLR